MAIVDNAVYVDGKRACEPDTLDETYELLRDRHGMGWIGLYRPDPLEMESVAEEFGIHRLAVNDTISAHQRPKLERYGDVLFTVLRSARYRDDVERVEFGELHVFTGKDFVVTVRHAESPDLGLVRKRLEESPELLKLGPEAVLYAILDQVVDEYEPVIAGLQGDIDEIEDQVFGSDPEVSRRIYELLREVVKFIRATQSLPGMIADLRSGFEKYGIDAELQRYLRDVADHVERVVDQAAGFKVLLINLIGVNATMVGQRQNEETRRLSELSLRQNEEVKRISSWAAILFAPTLVGTVYGMNFTHMPELHWRVGYPFAMLLMLLVGVVLHTLFKRRGWL
ncbi:magnesium and cobalt transport protein CorA [Streptomyces sp. SID13031]|uniref:magnesium and cobalt transport protein CorA n=1 Tax=Streptomyces sp. SID13031 TaxID=2706046 RepID=UPI0013CDC106|nr:magnesium and cobalt transport protein CorA [Streptomyces sp. SID13031]NEA36055.1 magnesium and cobalt transport protein CorA [Streptomyces sp. SID13031]